MRNMMPNRCKHEPKVANTSQVRFLLEEIISVALFVGAAYNQGVVVQNRRHFLIKPVSNQLSVCKLVVSRPFTPYTMDNSSRLENVLKYRFAVG